ncbi:hypothetical protein [Micromonospora humida]|uniref:hypothetical protein n=1 Tax=Micromonospora humida TaxID=2809018 RepID=UPI003411FCD8
MRTAQSTRAVTTTSTSGQVSSPPAATASTGPGRSGCRVTAGSSTWNALAAERRPSALPSSSTTTATPAAGSACAVSAATCGPVNAGPHAATASGVPSPRSAREMASNAVRATTDRPVRSGCSASPNTTSAGRNTAVAGLCSTGATSGTPGGA